MTHRHGLCLFFYSQPRNDAPEVALHQLIIICSAWSSFNFGWRISTSFSRQFQFWSHNTPWTRISCSVSVLKHCNILKQQDYSSTLHHSSDLAGLASTVASPSGWRSKSRLGNILCSACYEGFLILSKKPCGVEVVRLRWRANTTPDYSQISSKETLVSGTIMP